MIDFKQLKNDPALSLRDDERALMRARLLTHMRGAKTSSATLWFARPSFATAFALVLIVATGSVSYAAEGALPGEPLYGMKVSVNENVESFLAPTFEAKAGVAVRQAEERMREAEVLAAGGKLSLAVADTAAARVEELIEDAELHADTIEEEGGSDRARTIRARIDATLAAHVELLSAQAEDTRDENAEGLRALAFAAEVASGSDEAAATSLAVEVDTTEAVVRALEAHDRAKDRIEDLGRDLDEDELAVETSLELSGEYATLAAEFDAQAELALNGDAWNAADGYARIEKRAIRALTFVRAARHIREETDQEAVITFERSTPPMANARAKAGPEAATMVLTLEAATTSDEDSAEEAQAMDSETSEPTLQFHLRSRHE